MKIGIIQTRGLGDIIIAIPIAMYYINRGCTIHWPIDSTFIESFKDSFPEINFIPVNVNLTGNGTAAYFYSKPLEELLNIKCDSILCLYSHLSGLEVANPRMSHSLSFDAYKYAVSKVPFQEKWTFHPRRNVVREALLFPKLTLDPTEKYTIIHNQCSAYTHELDQSYYDSSTKNIFITPITDNIFDWIGVLERCHNAILIDSVYANLVEQLNLKVSKKFIFRSATAFTPILLNHWEFI